MRKALLFLCLLLCSSRSFAEPISSPTGYVNDYANLLSTSQKVALEQRLSSLTSAQIAVVTLKDLGEQPISDVARKIFDRWGIGDAGHDNGILLLIAIKERKIRIETGYGMEGKIPDLVAGRIIREVISPKLHLGDYYSGISEGIDALVARVEGQGVEPPPKNEIELHWYLLLFIILLRLLLDIKLSHYPLVGKTILLTLKKRDVIGVMIGCILLSFLSILSALTIAFFYFIIRLSKILAIYYPETRKSSRHYRGGGSGRGGFGGGRGGGGGASGSF